HRRESFGAGFARICDSLGKIARRDDVEIVYPVHLNPNVRGPVTERLSAFENIKLIEPLDYQSFVYLMTRCHLILTDSGGVQEEALPVHKTFGLLPDALCFLIFVTSHPNVGGCNWVLAPVDWSRLVHRERSPKAPHDPRPTALLLFQ